MNAMKWLFLTALAGHLLCGICDCLLIYMPNGRFRAEYMKDSQKLAEVFDGMPLRNAVLSMVLGCFAMCMMFFGYMAIYIWVKQFAPLYAALILLSIGLIFTFGMAHHILCGVPEWLYVRLGRTEEAREIITDLFKKTSVTMLVCYAGFLIFGISLFLAVFNGYSPLPKWACIFNTTLLMLVLTPLRIGGAGNWAGAIMFLGLLFQNARLYMSEIESRYLTGEVRRKVIFGHYKLPMVRTNNRKVLLKDGQILDINGIKVECILCPGHTWGHMVYLIDDEYLFTGDTLWFGADGGYSFINSLAEDNELAIRSLKALESNMRKREVKPKIITGHTGWTDDLDFAFRHIDKVCNSLVRQKPHDPDAPYDGYEESEDTEERARFFPLAKQKEIR